MNSINGNMPHALPVPLLDIQLAHDMLAQIINEDDPPGFLKAQDKQAQLQMMASLDVLCWVLGHENDAFKENIAAISKHLEDLGYEFNIDPSNYGN